MSILATTRQRVLYEAREIWRNSYVTFDSETTGLEWEDQIIQWAVCDQEGNVLGSSYVKPTVDISEGAFEIHGISAEQLADAPSFPDVWPTIRDLLADRTVVIYNADFDIGKLWASARPYGIEIPFDFIKSVCAMHLFARFYDDVHEYWGSYIWQKLTTAIAHLEIDVPGQAHDATHDAAATALLIQEMAKLADKELPPGWHPPVYVPCAGGCGGSMECAEADDIWYCHHCGLEHGVFHCCPGCTSVVGVPTSGFFCDDLCEYCHKALHREKMLLIGAWHRCPDSPYHIVETSDTEEPCENCKLQRKWKHQQEEAQRARQERIERERKEHRRAYAKEYRQRRKERERQNAERAAMGLPPLEVQQAKPVEEIFNHHGHQFQRRKDHYGRPEVYCLRCEASWSKPPHGYCAGMKAYRSWTAIPEHLKTRTQLLKLQLKPTNDQKPEAVMEGYFDRYCLYDKNMCVPVERKPRAKKDTASA